jgi:hypothetical protein
MELKSRLAQLLSVKVSVLSTIAVVLITFYRILFCRWNYVRLTHVVPLATS